MALIDRLKSLILPGFELARFGMALGGIPGPVYLRNPNLEKLWHAKNKEPGFWPGSLSDYGVTPYGQVVVNVLGSCAMTTPRAVAATRTN